MFTSPGDGDISGHDDGAGISADAQVKLEPSRAQANAIEVGGMKSGSDGSSGGEERVIEGEGPQVAKSGKPSYNQRMGGLGCSICSFPQSIVSASHNQLYSNALQSAHSSSSHCAVKSAIFYQGFQNIVGNSITSKSRMGKALKKLKTRKSRQKRRAEEKIKSRPTWRGPLGGPDTLSELLEGKSYSDLAIAEKNGLTTAAMVDKIVPVSTKSADQNVAELVEDPLRKEFRLMVATMKETMREDRERRLNYTNVSGPVYRPETAIWHHSKIRSLGKPVRFSWVEKKATAHHVYVSKKHKLMLTTIPKVACTEFMRLMFRMTGDTNWKLDPHFRTKRPVLAQLPFSGDESLQATAILNDPTWTKGVFFRDPAERLLSAYIDKFVRNNKYSLVLFKVRAPHKATD